MGQMLCKEVIDGEETKAQAPGSVVQSQQSISQIAKIPWLGRTEAG